MNREVQKVLSKTMSKNPLVIIALDAGEGDFVQQWTRAGDLPNIAALMRRGCSGTIGGPELVSSKGAWLTFWSGISPHEHGYYFDLQLKPGAYDFERVTARDASALPFWSHLRQGTKKAAVIDAPETCALGDVPGVQLADWSAHNLFNTARAPVSAQPASLIEVVRRIADEPTAVLTYKPGAQPHEDLEAARLLQQRVEQKGKVCRHLLAQHDYDLIVVGFSESHTAAHRFWNYRGGGDDLEHAILDVYHAIDREIGLMLAQLPAEANVFVVSPFGMKDQYRAQGFGDAFCRELGYQSFAAPVGLSPLALARRAVPPRWRAGVSRWLPFKVQERLQADQFRSATDWAKTRAFALPSINTSFIRVNLCGREPTGIVEPGREYESLLAEIEADLLALKDARSGKPAVEKVTQTVRAFRCRPPCILPDLFIEWQASSQVIERIAHPKMELVQEKPPYSPSSYHRFRGFFIAAGPSISARDALGEVAVLDFAPTFLALLGQPQQSLTGRVMAEVMQSWHQQIAI